LFPKKTLFEFESKHLHSMLI